MEHGHDHRVHSPQPCARARAPPSRSPRHSPSSRSSEESSPGASPSLCGRGAHARTTSRSRSRSSRSGSRRSRQLPERTFGYKRAEVLAALANGVTLVAAIWIFVEAIRRLEAQPRVLGGWMLVIALVGIAVNLSAGAILYRA